MKNESKNYAHKNTIKPKKITLNAKKCREMYRFLNDWPKGRVHSMKFVENGQGPVGGRLKKDNEEIIIAFYELYGSYWNLNIMVAKRRIMRMLYTIDSIIHLPLKDLSWILPKSPPPTIALVYICTKPLHFVNREIVSEKNREWIVGRKSEMLCCAWERDEIVSLNEKNIIGMWVLIWEYKIILSGHVCISSLYQ